MKKEMNKKSYIIIAIVAVLVVLCAMCCMGCCKSKVATVNAPMIVARSAAIRELQHEQQLQYEELQKWLQESDRAVKKQTTSTKKKELMARLQAELQQKQIVMQQEYAAKTQKIEEEIIAVVEKVAKKKGFRVVMDKNSVIVGGVDITEEVINKLEEAEVEIATKNEAEEPDVETADVKEEAPQAPALETPQEEEAKAE